MSGNGSDGREPYAAGAPPVDGASILRECRQLFLDHLLLCVRDAGVSDAAALEDLQRGAGECFDAMASPQGRAGFEQAKGLTASRITLINDHELAISIKLGELSRTLFEATASQLWKLSLRLAVLLGRDDIEPADNPVGADAVCTALGDMCGAMRCDSVSASLLLDGVGKRLASDLPLLYAELDELLVRRNVHPTRRARSRESAAAKSGDGSARSAADPLAALARAVESRSASAAPARQHPSQASGDVAIAGTGTGTGAAADPAAMAFAAATFNELIARLGAQQVAAATTGDLFAAVPQASASTAPLRALRGGELQPMLTAPQVRAIDVLALIFDAVFADSHLPDAIKVALSRLQIPVLKAAFLDPSFFSDASHPARALLDEIGRCAVGLPVDAAADHPLCAKVNEIAVAVAAQFDRDPDSFDRQTAALETYAAQRDHDVQAATEAYVPLASLQERRDLAAARALQVTQAMAAAPLPPALSRFLAEDWRQVLAAVHFENGEDSAAWRDCRRVGEDLVWSIQPKPVAEERQRLAAMIPTLLRRITDGLKLIGVAAAARAPLFDACFELQTAALRGKTAKEDAATQPPAAVETGVAEPELSLFEMNSRTLKTLHGSAADDEPLPTDIDIGTWVQFELPGSEVACGRLCWISPALHMLLFGNPDWNFALFVAPGVLARQLRAGRASLQSRSPLFAGAASAALRTLS